MLCMGLLLEMHDKMMKGNPPTMTLPVRSKSNIGFDKKLEFTSTGRRRRLETRHLLVLPDNF